MGVDWSTKLAAMAMAEGRASQVLVRGCPRIDGFVFGAELWWWCCNNDDDDDAKAQLRRASNGQSSAELAARYRQEASRCRHVMYKQGTLHAPSIGATGLGGCGDFGLS